MILFKSQLEKITSSGYYRERAITNSAQDRILNINKKNVLSFASNDYLGMSNNRTVVNELIKSANKYGVGSGASPLITGYSSSHHYLEKELCEYLNTDSCLVLNSGYAANLCLLSIFDQDKTVFQDRESHNSIIESSKINKLKINRYKHLDDSHLSKLLHQSNDVNSIIFSESVFSMSGDVTDLNHHLYLKEKYKALLFVDDAHGFAISKKSSSEVDIENSCSALGTSPSSMDAYIGTFGKAVGTAGAFISGNKDLIEMIVQKGKAYIYSTALPRCIVDATRKSLRYLARYKTKLNMLHENIVYMNNECKKKGLATNLSNVPIKSFLVANPDKVIDIRNDLLAQGILVQAIRYPTVPHGTDRLRITLSSNHKKKDIDKLLNSLENANCEEFKR